MRYLIIVILLLNTLPGHSSQSFGQSFSNSFSRTLSNQRNVYLHTIPTYTRVPLSRTESLNRCPGLVEHEAELKSLTRNSYKVSGVKSFNLKRKAEKLQKKLTRDCYTTIIAQ